jgi:preprotein translocase subunit Sss1
MKPSLDEWLRFVVGVTMALTLVGIVGVVLVFSGVCNSTDGWTSPK